MTQTKVSIITGFLGVGKTTFIINLLADKPENENWAIVVNEFGKIGVDALLLQNPSVTVKQVAGGCACCDAKLTFQIALNQLLKSQKLDRIIIEPSGLAHADSLIEILKQTQYQSWLTVNNTITIIDPMQFAQAKYRNHEIYIRQLNSADALYANKSSGSSVQAINGVGDYANEKQLPVFYDGDADSVSLHLLDSIKPRQSASGKFYYVSKSSERAFFHGTYEPHEKNIYHQSRLEKVLTAVAYQRVKGVVNTDQGLMTINAMDQQVTISAYNGSATSSLIEVISTDTVSTIDIETMLSAALLSEDH
jgi:G3E family GTPase